MTLKEISDLIKELLEVDDIRYPPLVRAMHINQGIEELAQMTDFPFDNFYESNVLMSGSEIPLFSLIAGRRVIRVKSIVHDDGALGPKLADELEADTGEVPSSFAHFGMSLYLDGDASLLSGINITARSKPVTLVNDSDENLWTQYIPYAVAYKACIPASVWLVEEERSIVFKQLLDEVILGASVEYMMQVESPGGLESL